MVADGSGSSSLLSSSLTIHAPSLSESSFLLSIGLRTFPAAFFLGAAAVLAFGAAFEVDAAFAFAGACSGHEMG
jgi:hypothetical protein